MSEGTSLDDIESGTIQYEADQAAMNAIMADMNALEPEPSVPSMPSMPSMPPMPPMPPMQPPMQPREPFQERFTAQYEPVRSKEPNSVEFTPKKNGWSQMFDNSRDALIVGILVCFFSLPALHTLLGKYLPWAYKVGGSMSWIGFLLLFVVSTGSYILYQTIVKKFGL
jgi:hypothetical protein